MACRFGLAALLALCAACGSGSTAQSEPVAPAITYPLGVAATGGELTVLNSDLSVHGVGRSRIGTIAIDHGAGQVELDGTPVNTAAYVVTHFPGQILHQALAVESNRLWVLFFYCTQAGALLDVYYENTDGDLGAFDGASGACGDSGQTSTVQVGFPPFALPPVTAVRGFQIDGPGIALDGSGTGAIALGPHPLNLLPFATVDCRTACGQPGWTELHSLIWDEASAALSFTIVYLLENEPGDVELAYSLGLPQLTDSLDGRIGATWKRLPQAGAPAAERPAARQVTVPPRR
jgi:hypothetical protein